jgi:hypothetical protein
MVGSLILTYTNLSRPSSLKCPSTLGYQGRQTNSWWACFKLILNWPKTVSSWRISCRASNRKHKWSKQKKKKRRNLTQRLNLLKESWIWLSPPKNLEERSSILYCLVTGTPRPLLRTWWKIRSNFNSQRLPKYTSIMCRDGKRNKDSWNLN